jgi:hypothetical protein
MGCENESTFFCDDKYWGSLNKRIVIWINPFLSKTDTGTKLEKIVMPI